jgi:ubiquinol-cytochrome c reductase cytochrome b subunit
MSSPRDHEKHGHHETARERESRVAATRFDRMVTALDDRMAIRALVRWMLDEPVVGGARWAYVFGSALVTLLTVQAVTGWLLMSAYAPSATTAWASVHHISFKMSGGWLVRGIHHFGSGATVVLLGAHLVQTALFGAYKRPRELNWWFGLVLMFLVLGFSLTGYLLPWDQKGYWATRVATNIMGTLPFVGASVQRIVQGGAQYGSLTLTRFYALHVGVLPALLAIFTLGHVALMRKHGITPPASADHTKLDRFYPKQVALDVVASCLVVGTVLFLAFREHGAPLDAPADPSSDYPARPEWYFLALFQLLKYFEGPTAIVGTVIVPGLAVGYLFALPLLDRAKTNAVRERLPWLLGIALGFAGLTALTVVAKRADARDAEFKKSRAVADERASYAREIAMNGVPPEGPLVMLDRDPKLRGEAIWQSKCKGCHTLDGKGGNSAPDLKGWGTAAWVEQTLRDPDGPTRFAKSPYKGMMASQTLPAKPGEKPSLTEQEAKQVSAYVANEGTPADREAGKKSFDLACDSCHARAGQGGDVDDVAPDLAGWGSYRWLRSQIANPMAGDTYKPAASEPKMKGHMGAFADDPEIGAEIDVITRWVFEKSKGRAPTDDELKAAASKPAAAPTASAVPPAPVVAPSSAASASGSAPAASASASASAAASK